MVNKWVYALLPLNRQYAVESYEMAHVARMYGQNATLYRVVFVAFCPVALCPGFCGKCTIFPVISDLSAL